MRDFNYAKIRDNKWDKGTVPLSHILYLGTEEPSLCPMYIKNCHRISSAQPWVAIYQESADAGWWRTKAFSVNLSMHRGAIDLYGNSEACFKGGRL